MDFTKTFSFKIMLFTENFSFKIVLFKNGRKTQNLHILRGELNLYVILWVQFFFKVCFSKIDFSAKSCYWKKNFFFKILLSEKYFSLQIHAF